MGAIHVHEFMSLDGVIDAPVWTFEYGFVPGMERVMSHSLIDAIAYTSHVPLFQLVVISLRAWLNHEQTDLIAFLREENRVLKSRLGGRRLRFEDSERR